MFDMRRFLRTNSQSARFLPLGMYSRKAQFFIPKGMFHEHH